MSAVLTHLRQLDAWGLMVALVDVLLVAYIIYRILLLIRGTRAAYMLTGLLLVAGIFVGANQLALATLGWLLDHVISYAILIVIIVFQADIRRALSRIGRGLFAPARSGEQVAVIEEVVQACEAMAGRRIGALIVLERDADLSEFIDPGTPLDARVTKALLTNIFSPHPSNPLHDGAAVIKGHLVQQAGAILPLSRNPGLDKDLGTRHRAGVGITEETDAIAVVVSEQRGSIGLCTAGLLHMGLNGPTLRRELLALVASGERSRFPRLTWVLKRWNEAISSEPAAGRAPRATRPTGQRTAELRLSELRTDHTGETRPPEPRAADPTGEHQTGEHR